MKSWKRSAFIAAFATFGMTGISADAFADILIILLDRSGTSLITKDQGVANKMATYAAMVISEMEEGDTVYIQTIGDYGVGEHDKVKINISAEFTADQAAQHVGSLIAMVPQLIATDEWQVDQTTHLWATLRDIAQLHHCPSGAIEVLSLGDGIEDSDTMTEADMISGEFDLPPIEEFAGCHLTMVGVGQRAGKSFASQVPAIEGTWKRWAEASKAGSVATTSDIPL